MVGVFPTSLEWYRHDCHGGSSLNSLAIGMTSISEVENGAADAVSRNELLSFQ